jgi:hypothetical protein
MVVNGQVSLAGRVLDDPFEDLDTDGLVLHVNGEAWPYAEKAVVLLHKPAGYECSTRPRHHPSVLSLLPAPLRTRVQSRESEKQPRDRHPFPSLEFRVEVKKGPRQSLRHRAPHGGLAGPRQSDEHQVPVNLKANRLGHPKRSSNRAR